MGLHPIRRPVATVSPDRPVAGACGVGTRSPVGSNTSGNASPAADQHLTALAVAARKYSAPVSSTFHACPAGNFNVAHRAVEADAV